MIFPHPRTSGERCNAAKLNKIESKVDSSPILQSLATFASEGKSAEINLVEGNGLKESGKAEVISFTSKKFSASQRVGLTTGAVCCGTTTQPDSNEGRRKITPGDDGMLVDLKRRVSPFKDIAAAA